MNMPREIKLVWALLGAAAVAVLVTYSRLPAYELYHVSRSGIAGGLSRALVDLNFPDALAALAILGIVGPRLPPRGVPLAVLAAALCLVVVFPGVVSQDDLDAKWINAVPAAGVALAFVLSLAADGPRSPRRARGDPLRLALAAVLVLLAAPWIAAELGFYLDGVPVLGWLFQTGKLASFHDPLHHAVHHGVHHGLQGMLLALTALVLSRLPAPRAAGVYLALMLAYGIGNMANDGWLEQVVERGWSSHSIPSVLEPKANWGWLAILAVTPLIWWLWFRQPSRTTPAAARPAISASE